MMKQFDVLVEALGSYYVVCNNKQIILANVYTHLLYDVRITSAFCSEDSDVLSISFVPLMVEYEKLFADPIENLPKWDGDISSL